MFGRHLEMKVVKDRNDGQFADVTPAINVEDIDRIAKRVVKYVALGAMATFAVVVTMNTASEIAVNRFSIERKEEDD